ncbi:DUF885 family protein [Sphingomonas sp. JC676]|uniref:DUF885 family protein n=1 Tax=Sphingomonas sp. JC676 TaxID=2768065 RepID=UPI0016581B93|nr:DUF885 family protein [Sphingomonas sp. JC676]MBC9032271.1 DUF885 family protein [Sphingomonas sp. JC676]
MISRRHMLSAASAALAVRSLPAFARPQAGDAELRIILDRAAKGSPEQALRDLATIDMHDLSPSARLDLVTARSGLAIDAELLRRFPFGRFGRPYRVTPLAGAWIKHNDAAAIDADTIAIQQDAMAGAGLPAGLLARTIAAIEAVRASTSGPIASALGRQLAALRDQSAAAPPPGVGRIPDGGAYYALLLRRITGDDANPASAERRFEQERRRLSARADALLSKLGHKRGSLGARYSALWRDPRWLYSDDDAGRDRAVADMNRALDAARRRLPAQFAAWPPRSLDVGARRMSRADEAAGRSGYRELPTVTRSGAYYVDLKDIARRPAWTLPGVVHHELLPGHMIQLPIEADAGQHSLRLDYTPAFPEGWAIYAEQMAAADGSFAGDPLAELGHIHWMLFRSCRALADIGIHLHGWSLEQAHARLVEWQGEPGYFAPFPLELDRIAAEPASRAAEAFVWLTVADLARGRERKAFHRIVLADGRKRTDELRRLVTGRK